MIQYPTIDEWVKTCGIPVRCYATVKSNEVLIHATAWMTLENSVLSELSQPQKDRYCMIPLSEISVRGKFIETKRLKITRDSVRILEGVFSV